MEDLIQRGLFVKIKLSVIENNTLTLNQINDTPVLHFKVCWFTIDIISMEMYFHFITSIFNLKICEDLF